MKRRARRSPEGCGSFPDRAMNCHTIEFTALVIRDISHIQTLVVLCGELNSCAVEKFVIKIRSRIHLKLGSRINDLLNRQFHSCYG